MRPLEAWQGGRGEQEAGQWPGNLWPAPGKGHSAYGHSVIGNVAFDERGWPTSHLWSGGALRPSNGADEKNAPRQCGSPRLNRPRARVVHRYRTSPRAFHRRREPPSPQTSMPRATRPPTPWVLSSHRVIRQNRHGARSPRSGRRPRARVQQMIRVRPRARVQQLLASVAADLPGNSCGQKQRIRIMLM